ncbi:MAG TPA: hypothetical protein PLI77_09770 [Bacteroidales bacterium]|nr:hypothetical protein [Bacteroidales bacterium]
METVVYDKFSWHYPEGQNCTYNEAKRYFFILMSWLKKQELLSEEGLESFDVGIDDDFSINSHMLNNKGNLFLKQYYDKWMKKNSYSDLDTNLLDNMYKEFESK